MLFTSSPHIRNYFAGMSNSTTTDTPPVVADDAVKQVHMLTVSTEALAIVLVSIYAGSSALR